jgi:hypothetical protein
MDVAPANVRLPPVGPHLLFRHAGESLRQRRKQVWSRQLIRLPGIRTTPHESVTNDLAARISIPGG